uniref:Transthyretin-like family protein n=1 Tax=Parascaris univalens TaxID=6257 RepID=A0A915B8L4_PARUN
MFLRGTLLLLAFASTAFCMLGRMKNVTARGQLICGTRNYANGKVELWEDDRLNFDDLLNTTNSNSLGRFSIYGQTREIRNIEPYLLITHNCDNGILNTRCTYTDRYTIPKESVGKTYDMREVRLNEATKKRKSKCSK